MTNLFRCDISTFIRIPPIIIADAMPYTLMTIWVAQTRYTNKHKLRIEVYIAQLPPPQTSDRTNCSWTETKRGKILRCTPRFATSLVWCGCVYLANHVDFEFA